jgi:predicted nucleotidyltransferase
MASEAVIRNLSLYLRLLIEKGIPVDRGLLFGSYATGQSTEESNLDLLVISPLFDRWKTGPLLDTLWRLRRQIDSRIEPVAIGKREFEKEWGSPIIDSARHQGIEIKPAPSRKSP